MNGRQQFIHNMNLTFYILSLVLFAFYHFKNHETKMLASLWSGSRISGCDHSEAVYITKTIWFGFCRSYQTQCPYKLQLYFKQPDHYYHIQDFHCAFAVRWKKEALGPQKCGDTLTLGSLFMWSDAKLNDDLVPPPISSTTVRLLSTSDGDVNNFCNLRNSLQMHQNAGQHIICSLV